MRFAAALRMPGGVLAHFDCGFDFAFRHQLEAIGAHGAATLRDPWHGNAPGIELRTDAGQEHIEIDFVDPYRLEVENFSAAVTGREPLLIGPEEIVAQARAIEALYAAADSGRAVAPSAQAR
jgi:xylose dehydrogenase (NAD/NADP)